MKSCLITGKLVVNLTRGGRAMICSSLSCKDEIRLLTDKELLEKENF